MVSSEVKASVIIPARDAMETIDKTVQSVINEIRSEDVEIIIVNDVRDESLALLTDRYPVRVIDGDGTGPAAARNIGVAFSRGKILIFLDADCRVKPGWLSAHLTAHSRYLGLVAVGGSICMEPDAHLWARCDHYCSWYNVNPGLPASWVPNHPAANLSVLRSTFERIGLFREDLPVSGVHEETEWQKRLLCLGGRIRFEPKAAVWHRDRDDFRSFMSHNFRWGYNSLEVKGGSDVSRFPWLFRRSLILILGFVPFAIVHMLYIILCWLRGGNFEPLFLSPLIFSGCLTYAFGMAVGGIRLQQKRITREN
jgi:glycosyltransferase involved in cell wall biosynthesis